MLFVAVSIDEFFEKVDLEWTSFNLKVFGAIDYSGENKIDFGEFFVGMWNYCTLEKDALIHFTYNVMDGDGSGNVDRSEIRSLVKMVFGKKNVDKKVDDVLKKMDKDGSGQVSATEFMAMHKSCPSLIQPVFHLQSQLVQKCCGKGYWARATRMRKAMAEQQDLVKMHAQLYKIQKVKPKSEDQ